MEGLRSMYGSENGGMVMKTRGMVVVDETPCSKHAMMWALTHLVNKGDSLTILHVLPFSIKGSDSSSSPYLATSLGSLCKASKPQVEVEALVIEEPKLATVLSQVKKLEASVLVVGQKKPSTLSTWTIRAKEARNNNDHRVKQKAKTSEKSVRDLAYLKNNGDQRGRKGEEQWGSQAKKRKQKQERNQ